MKKIKRSNLPSSWEATGVIAEVALIEVALIKAFNWPHWLYYVAFGLSFISLCIVCALAATTEEVDLLKGHSW